MSHAFNSLNSLRRLTKVRAGVALVLTLAFVAVVGCTLSRGVVAYGKDQELEKLNRFVQGANTPAMKLFREGRDLIEEEEWAKAAEKFRGFINTYPRDNDVDAALYWHAYALKRSGNLREAAKQLGRLIKDFPNSGWRDEADAMLTEIAPALGQTEVINQSLNTDSEELKIIALQSLFDSSPERAISYVNEWLKPTSTASRKMKEAAVSLLGAHGGKQAIPLLLDIARNQPDLKLRQTAIHRLGEEGGDAVLDDLMQIYEADRDGKVKQQVLHAISEMESPRAHAKLLAVARNNAENIEMRRFAIHRLGEREDANAYVDLVQIYDADQTGELKMEVLHALSESEDPRAQAKLLEVARSGNNIELRRQAIHWLGEKEGESTIDELMRLYQTEQSADVKQQILHAFSEMESARAKAKLSEVARNANENSELRRYAIHWIGESDDANAIQTLVTLYDGERDGEIKQTLIHAFGESKQKAALRKLMQIARGDASIELRKQAIHKLGESDDPEALRFLEEILKP